MIFKESESKLLGEIAEIKELLAKTKQELDELKKERASHNASKAKSRQDIKNEIDEELKSVTGNHIKKKVTKKTPLKKALSIKPKETIEARKLDSPKAAL